MEKLEELEIRALDMEARGVGHRDGKVIFVEGALPGERVTFRSLRSKKKYETAVVSEVLHASSQRVTPRCAYYEKCGGCSMQHLDAAAQVAIKQRVLEDNLWHLGRVRAETILRPIHGPTWGYRYRARLAVFYMDKKGGALVGFHERKRSFVADMSDCHILPRQVADLLPLLRVLVNGLSIRTRLPQIELAVGSQITVLVLRVLAPPSAADENLLRAFADQHGIQFWLQPQGPDSAVPFHPLDAPALSYALPEFDVVMPFRPTDFTQVNSAINRVLVTRALALLQVQPQDRVVDFFCGLGNFTLPLARQAAWVLGIEGSEALVARARDNATHNRIGNVEFAARNLFDFTAADWQALNRTTPIDRILLDPPRDGAAAVAKALADPASHKPQRLVYVSCNPATLARDAAVLVHEAGYRLQAAGVINMFPHTSHVESMAVFERVEQA
ncbi:MAG: 23S rRNA (uracil(1939)-C(5))-methyltransferase RlmD [Burkholderiaceae bacterium]|nr:MAG: 23S rRNA (uracil(1939)-C(5))-methyltransferase RlmD [Burkholderiaceae bacterium]